MKSLKDHYILCGYGRIGSIIARELWESKIPLVVVDTDLESMEGLESEGIPYINDDATSDEVLLDAGDGGLGPRLRRGRRDHCDRRRCDRRLAFDAQPTAGVLDLEHPHIGVVHEIDEVDGHLFIAMAYYPGQTLTQRIRQGALPVESALTISEHTRPQPAAFAINRKGRLVIPARGARMMSFSRR